MAQQAGRRSAETAARTRSAILQAALDHFAEHGFEGASLRRIAAEAGTTHGLIRHHFGTKEGLWRAMVDDCVGEFEARHRPLLTDAAGRDPVESLRGFVGNYVRVSAERPGVAKVLMNDCSRPGPRLDFFLERMMPIHRAIEPVFLAAQRRGVLGHHDPDSFFLFLVMLGAFPPALPGFANVFHHGRIDSGSGLERHLDRVLRTLFGE